CDRSAGGRRRPFAHCPRGKSLRHRRPLRGRGATEGSAASAVGSQAERRGGRLLKPEFSVPLGGLSKIVPSWWAGRESNPHSFRYGFTDRWARHVPLPTQPGARTPELKPEGPT